MKKIRNFLLSFRWKHTSPVFISISCFCKQSFLYLIRCSSILKTKICMQEMCMHNSSFDICPRISCLQIIFANTISPYLATFWRVFNKYYVFKTVVASLSQVLLASLKQSQSSFRIWLYHETVRERSNCECFVLISFHIF